MAFFEAPEGLDEAPETAAEALGREVAARLEAATSLSEPDVRWWWEPGARRGPTPEGEGDHLLQITRTLWVHRRGSASDAHERRGGDPSGPAPEGTVVRLEPGLGFGDAGHPTTRAALAQLEAVVTAGDTVLDLGTGTGILGVTAALLGAGTVEAVDRDEYACRAARVNAEVNGVAERVRVTRRSVEVGDLTGWGPWDGVLANVVPGVLAPLLPELSAELREGGWLVLAGASGGERDGLRSAARRAGLRLARERMDDGWWTAVFRR